MSSPDPAMLKTYFRLMNTNGAAQVYHAALELGVLGALEAGPRSAEQLAEACDLQPRPTALLLEALAAVGVISRQDEQNDAAQYALTAVTRLLLGSEYRELGNQYWRHLPRFLRTGTPLKKMDDAAQSEAHYQSQAAILGWMLTPAAQSAAATLHERFGARPLAILDVGAGSAIWSLSLACLHAESHVTAVDWPAVLEVAKETAANFNFTDRLTTIAGDCHEVELPAAEFDVAIVANLTHLQTPQQNAALFRKIHAALRPRGELVIIDAFPGSAAGDAPFALYQLGLALRTESSRVYPAEELQAMLNAEDFAAGDLLPIDASPHVVGMLICPRRAGN